ncbi:MAG: hypothetical protein P8Y63_08950 [Deltaproteobacteria bacterium]|jgi:hypothetical protein
MLIHDLKGPLSEVVANLDILSYSIPATIENFRRRHSSPATRPGSAHGCEPGEHP